MAAAGERPPDRDVVLTLAAWAHICSRHADLSSQRAAILLTVRAPDVTTRDHRHPNRWRFYRRGAGPSRWLVVVVDFDLSPARIVTAHAFRKEHPR